MDQLGVNYREFPEEQKNYGIVILNQVLKMVTPLISAAVAAKAKSPQSAQITSNILKSVSGGKILSLTDMHGPGMRLKVM